MHFHRLWSRLAPYVARLLPALVVAAVLAASIMVQRDLPPTHLTACTGYAGPPSVTGVSPSQGSLNGGTSVIISGLGFCATTSIQFGTTPAPGYTVISDTSIQVFSPAHALGQVDVTVTTTIATSPKTAADLYSYISAACSTTQYQLPGNDGVTWRTIDPALLTVTFTPSVSSLVILTGNADLWTSTSGVNQDIGIGVDGGAYPRVAGQPEAWKESGGSAGTFSPNAATVEAVLQVAAGIQYTAELEWKANHLASGTIWAGAGTVGGRYSPTCLSFRLVPAASSSTLPSYVQYHLSGSTGTTWTPMDAGGGLTLPTFTAPSSGSIVVSGSADLWTATAGFNQDIGITVNGLLVSWKESGGLAGTFSPNAAYVMGVVPVVSTGTYTAALVWKAHKNGASTIYAGAGPIFGKYSPTSITLIFMPAGTAIDAVTTGQPHLFGSNGSTWGAMDPALNIPSFTPTQDCEVVVSANADLWTANAGFNQDIGISVSGGVFPSVSGLPEAWKESGGLSGTYSPNAAYVHLVLFLRAATSYGFSLVWKANHGGASNIYAGAGPLAGSNSPTRLTLQPQNC